MQFLHTEKIVGLSPTIATKRTFRVSSDTVTRRMRSSLTTTGGSSQTELALATRESSLVGERVEGVSDE